MGSTGVIMKIVYICEECSEVATDEAITLVIIRGNGTLRIVGSGHFPLDEWDNLAKQLPNIVRQ